MNKKELAEAIASKQGIDLKTVEKVINCSIDTIVEAVAQGDSVQFVGFGTSDRRRLRIPSQSRVGPES